MRALIPLVLALWAAPVVAQTPKLECDPKDPAKCSTGLVAGQPAPFTGQLLTVKLAIDVGQRADGCDDRLKIELERVKGSADAKADLDHKLIEIERDAAKLKVQELQKALELTKDLEKPPPWYERPAAVAVISVVGTAAVFFLAAKTIQWSK